MTLAKLHDVKRVIFVSSTGVYADDRTEKNEPLVPKPSKPSGQALVAAEKIVRQTMNHWIILRLSGLSGPDREPGKWFSGKSNIPNGLNPVNMVHLDDCIEISLQIIDHQELDQEIFNICADTHPTKINFYTAQCRKLSLTPPQFIEEIGPHKIVRNTKIKEALNYTFIYSDPQRF